MTRDQKFLEKLRYARKPEQEDFWQKSCSQTDKLKCGPDNSVLHENTVPNKYFPSFKGGVGTDRRIPVEKIWARARRPAIRTFDRRRLRGSSVIFLSGGTRTRSACEFEWRRAYWHGVCWFDAYFTGETVMNDQNDRLRLIEIFIVSV